MMFYIRESQPVLEFFHYTLGQLLYSQFSNRKVGLNHVHCWKSVNIRGILLN